MASQKEFYQSVMTPSNSVHTRGKGAFLGNFAPLEILPESTFALRTTYATALMKSEKMGETGINTADRVIKDALPKTTSSVPEDTTYESLSDLMRSFFCDQNETYISVNDTSWDYYNSICGNGTNATSFNGSLSSNGSDSDILSGEPYRFWTLCLLIFPLFTVFGNVLVVMSVYRERSLRTVTNYFICSLAVADIMVAVVVMPPAVYMEVTQYWSLSDSLCDAWVASDVLACTASILNLTAISVDRFIAVTQPIKYSKHKNSKRVFVTLALTWIISIAIAAPIALGVNYSQFRERGACAFFNSDFLIYSSMGSFYIPSIIMIFLYWRIYRVLRMRAQAAMRSKKAKQLKEKNFTNVIENTPTVNAAKTEIEPTSSTQLNVAIDNGKISTYNTNKTPNTLTIQINEEVSVSNVHTDSQSSERYNDEDGSIPKSPGSIDDLDDEEDPGVDLIVNPVAVRHVEIQIDGNGNGSCVAETQTDLETKFSSAANANKTKLKQVTDHECLLQASGATTRKSNSRRKDKRGVAKFNFHMRTSRKRKEKSSTRKERKATKTLAIVLGVFLVCWVPFFTLNIINAICLRYDRKSAICYIDVGVINFFVWLGYINSFLNPLIYTIFNPEFRKAFRKILTEKC